MAMVSGVWAEVHVLRACVVRAVCCPVTALIQYKPAHGSPLPRPDSDGSSRTSTTRIPRTTGPLHMVLEKPVQSVLPDPIHQGSLHQPPARSRSHKASNDSVAPLSACCAPERLHTKAWTVPHGQRTGMPFRYDTCAAWSVVVA